MINSVRCAHYVITLDVIKEIMEDRIEELSQKIRDLCSENEEVDIKEEESVFYFYLLRMFNYHVTKGGFAQLLYNSQGNYLEDIDKALNSVGATRSLSYYQKAVRACLDSVENYQEFLSSDYVSENSLKNELQLIGVGYLSDEPTLIEESKNEILALMDEVEAWLKNK